LSICFGFVDYSPLNIDSQSDPTTPETILAQELCVNLLTRTNLCDKYLLFPELTPLFSMVLQEM